MKATSWKTALRSVLRAPAAQRTSRAMDQLEATVEALEHVVRAHIVLDAFNGALAGQLAVALEHLKVTDPDVATAISVRVQDANAVYTERHPGKIDASLLHGRLRGRS